MSDFNRKNNNSFWHSPLFLLVFFLILILFSYNILGLIEKERETAKKKDIELSKIESLRNRETSLIRDIERLKTDEGVEETIRDKYQVVKEGEKMVVIVDDEKKEDNVQVEDLKDHSFWGWIKKTFRL